MISSIRVGGEHPKRMKVNMKTREWRLIQEMMEQGEFNCLSSFSEPTKYHVQWWCRYTDKMYSALKNPNLMDALNDVLEQARADVDPWVTPEERKKTEERFGIKIYIPKGLHTENPD
jgi:hypothetical protein